VIRGQHFVAAIIEPLTAVVGNAAVGLQQCLKRGGTEADDHFGFDRIELAKQKRRTGRDFIRFGLTITGRTAFDDIADVNVGALQTHGFDHLREKFAGAADERKALGVFIGAGALADENELGFRAAVAEDDFVSRAVQLAAGAFAKVVADLEQRFSRELVCGVEQ